MDNMHVSLEATDPKPPQEQPIASMTKQGMESHVLPRLAPSRGGGGRSPRLSASTSSPLPKTHPSAAFSTERFNSRIIFAGVP